MKKILLILIAFIVILFSACSAEHEPNPEDEVLSIYHNFSFSFKTLTFTDTSRSDILFGLSDNGEEFFIAYDKITNVPFSAEEELAYREVLTILDQLNSESSVSMNRLLEYSLEEFSDECEKYGIEVSLTNVIMFNSFKELLETIIEDRGTSFVGISKVDYLNIRLGRTLTNDEKQSLELLQMSYYEVTRYQSNYENFITATYDEVIEYFENNSVTLTDIEKEQIQVALDILNELNENPPTE